MGLADFVKNRLQEAPNWLMLPLLHLNRMGDRIYGNAMLRFRRSIPSIDPEQKIVEMANYAIAHVPYYRDRYKGKRIASLADFKATFGFIDKETVMASPEAFTSDEADRLPHVRLRTSGTSGKPAEFLLRANRYVTEMAFLTRMWNRHGLNGGIRASVRRKQLPEGRDYMVNPATREIIFDGFRSDDPYMRTMQRVMKRNGVRTLYGYPSTIIKTLRQWRKIGLDTSFIRLAILTSEGVTPSNYSFIHDTLGIDIATHYGHTEKLIFIDQIDGKPTFAVEPSYGLCEIIDENGRETLEGELVGSTYYNKVMPLLRYRTGDYARATGEIRDFNGEKKPILDRITGRHDKTTIVRSDGSLMNISTMDFHDEYHLHAEGTQFVQHEPGKLIVRVIPSDGYTLDGDEAFITDYYGRLMLGRENVAVEHVEALEFLPNGKAPVLITTIPEEQRRWNA